MCVFAEFDALTGSRLSTIDIGAPVVRMSYSPTSGHAVIAILEVFFFLRKKKLCGSLDYGDIVVLIS